MVVHVNSPLVRAADSSSLLLPIYECMWLCSRSLLKTGQVGMVEAMRWTAAGRSRVAACGAAATSRPWATTTVLTQTPVPKPHRNPPWSPRGTPSSDLPAWIRGWTPQIVVLDVKRQPCPASGQQNCLVCDSGIPVSSAPTHTPTAELHPKLTPVLEVTPALWPVPR